MNGTVHATIDWRAADPADLEGARCILTTRSGTVIDGHLRGRPPHEPAAATRFTLDDAEETLHGLWILSIDPRAGTRILQPHITDLTILKEQP